MPVLDWIGKKAIVNHHRAVPYRLIHCSKNNSAGDPDAGNLLVHGDNLEALKSLLPYYAGKVKCAYIDPPFNTGSEDWIYNDNVSSPEIQAWLGKAVGKEAEDLSRHDKWLCMMYPRLRIMKEFLSKDGSIFVHIDDNEIGNAIALCDEVFGGTNRISIITFKQSSASGPKAVNPGIVTTNNFILYYVRDKNFWKPNRVFTVAERDDRYSKFISNFERPFAEWRLINLKDAFLASEKISSWKAAKVKYADDLEEQINQFVLENANRVVRTARVAPKDVNEDARSALLQSISTENRVFCSEREDKESYYFLNGEQLIFYQTKTKIIDGVRTTGAPLTNLWDDLLSNNLHAEGGVDFPKGKKPEALLKRCLEVSTNPGDLILDSFAGSGTTAAVAHKMGRAWITVEMGDHAFTHTAPRLTRVVSGEDTSGVTKGLNWTGGSGFRFCTLGETLFDPEGNVNGTVTFSDLAAHVFFCDTGSPIPKKADGSSSLIGTYQGRAIYLLFSQTLMGVPSAGAGNVLTSAILNALPPPDPAFAGTRVVYAEGCTVPDDRLASAGITFRQVPYQIEGI